MNVAQFHFYDSNSQSVLSIDCEYSRCTPRRRPHKESHGRNDDTTQRRAIAQSRNRAELSPIADEDWDSATDTPTSSLSLREEIAELLEAADAARFVAQRGTRNAPFMQDGAAVQQLTPAETRKISAPVED